ncbi:MAG TPA: DUF423 domain-containing protein [Xanthomonadales bacterium]|nr:DUF423 domain-containing protein [Xanthomonadales bacterium]
MSPSAARQWLAFSAAAYGLAAVLLAAVGAHSVSFATAADAGLWHTALEIHLFHAVAMLAVAALPSKDYHPALPYSGLALGLGTLLFSGSLYLRASGIDLLPGWLAPGGGLVLMAAWLWLALAHLPGRSHP